MHGEVESATALLSSGALGSYAASIVSERNTDIESRTFESELQPSEPDEVIVEDREFISEGPAYVPLPGKEDQKEPQSLMREPKTTFVSDGPAYIPLPELPEFDEPVSRSVCQRCLIWTICLNPMRQFHHCRIWMICFSFKWRGSNWWLWRFE